MMAASPAIDQDPADGGSPWLVVLDPEGRPVGRFPIRPGSNSIGAPSPQDGFAPMIDLSSFDGRWHVSRRHAVLDRDRDRLVLRDLGSTNGTTVDGRPLTTPVVLADGSEIVFAGDVRCRIERPEPADVPAPEAPGLAHWRSLLARPEVWPDPLRRSGASRRIARALGPRAPFRVEVRGSSRGEVLRGIRLAGPEGFRGRLRRAVLGRLGLREVEEFEITLAPDRCRLRFRVRLEPDRAARTDPLEAR